MTLGSEFAESKGLQHPLVEALPELRSARGEVPQPQTTPAEKQKRELALSLSDLREGGGDALLAELHKTLRMLLHLSQLMDLNAVGSGPCAEVIAGLLGL